MALTLHLPTRRSRCNDDDDDGDDDGNDGGDDDDDDGDSDWESDGGFNQQEGVGGTKMVTKI